MESEEVIEVTLLCRICLSLDDTMHNLNAAVLEEREDQRNICDLLGALFNLELLIHDELPNTICETCYKAIEQFYKLKSQYAKTQIFLTQLTDIPLKENEERPAEEITNPVEVIKCGQRYDLNQIAIEKPTPVSEKTDFNGFLRNLGNEVSVQFIKKNNIENAKHPSEETSETLENSNRNIDEEIDRLIICENEQVHKCSFCPKSFRTKQLLLKHQTLVHEKNVLLCDLCGFSAPNRKCYTYHMRKHKARRFRCPHCNKIFATSTTLKLHLQIHSNKLQFACGVCGKRFNYKTALTYHMRNHTGERNYVCSFCDMSFTMSHILARHLVTHTEERPYSCDKCHRKFKSNRDCKEHQILHRKKLPFECSLCGKGFSKKNNLNLHLMVHRGQHKCVICNDRTFALMDGLKMHYKKAHKDGLPPITDLAYLSDESYDDESFSFTESLT